MYMLSGPRGWATSMAVELGLVKSSSMETSSSSSEHKGEKTSILCSVNVGGKKSLVGPTLTRGINRNAKMSMDLDRWVQFQTLCSGEPQEQDLMVSFLHLPLELVRSISPQGLRNLKGCGRSGSLHSLGSWADFCSSDLMVNMLLRAAWPSTSS